MYEWKARCLFLGVGFEVCTFFHYAQCRFLQKWQTAYAEAIPFPRFDHKVMGQILHEQGRVRQGQVGKAVAQMLGVRTIVRFSLRAMEQAEPRLFGRQPKNEFARWLDQRKERQAVLLGGVGSAPLRWKGRSKTQDGTSLTIRLLFLRERDERLILLSLPLPILTHGQSLRIRRLVGRELGVPVGKILAACTHVHSGLNPSQIDAALPALEAAVGLAARRASASLVPVRTGVAGESVTGLSRLRRVLMNDDRVYSVRRAVPSAWNPESKPEFVREEGSLDNDLTVLRIETTAGRPLACVFHFAVHPIPDLHGYAADWIEAAMGGDMVCLPLNGALGDVDTPFEKDLGGSFGDEQLPKLGGILAGSVATLWARADLKDASRLRVIGSKETLTVHPRVCRDRGSDPVPWIAESARRGHFEIGMMAAQIGDFVMVTIPGELSSSLGLTLKDSRHFPFICPVGLANGYAGYLLDRKALKMGGYEADPSYWSLAAPGSAEKIVRRAKALVARLGTRPRLS